MNLYLGRCLEIYYNRVVFVQNKNAGGMYMIIEFVTFKSRTGITPEEEYADALKGAQAWLDNPDLIAKHFIRDGDSGGAVYIWPSREAAQSAHDDAWREGVMARTGGNPPQIRYFDLMMTSEPQIKKVTEYGLSATVDKSHP